MSTQVQFRRGSKTEHDAFTGALGEMTVETTNNRLVSHDGTRQGGFPHANFLDIIGQKFNAGDAGGTANALTLTFDYAPDAYAEYHSYKFKPAANNTGAATIDVNGVDAVAIKKHDGNGGLVDLDADDLRTGIPATITHDGTYFILETGSGGSGAPTVQVFTSSGTWNKPAGLKGVEVIVTGGGAAGNTSTVGTSSFGAHCSATGGSSAANIGGTGGIGSGGDLNIRGGSGFRGGTAADRLGGASFWGGGGCPSNESTLAAYGAGGSSASFASGGGAGGTAIKFIPAASLGSSETVTIGGATGGTNARAGVVMVREYY